MMSLHRLIPVVMMSIPALGIAGPLEEGRALEDAGDLAGARAKYEAAVAAAPADRDAAVRLVHVLIGLGESDAAEAKLKVLEAAVPKGTADAALLNERGRLMFNRKKLPEAARAFRAALAKDPGFRDAAYNVGIAESSLGNHEAARAGFRKTLAIDPGFLRGINAFAALEIRLRQYAAAASLLAEAQRIGPGEFDTLYNLGVLHGDQDQHEESARYFALAAARKPDSAETRNNLGRALLRLKRLDEAKTHLEEARRLNPKLAEPVFNLGTLSEERKAFAEAAELYRATLAMDPAFAEAAFRMGNLSLAKAQDAQAAKDEKAAEAAFGEARTWYGRAATINAAYPEALYNLALTLLQLRRLDEAAGVARRLVQVANGLASHHFVLGTVELQRGKAPEAERAFRAALKLDPTCSDCAMRLGSLLFQTGKLEQAAQVMRTRLKVDPKQVEAQYLLGLVLVRQGELPGARRAFEAVHELKPDHLDGLNNLAEIALRQKRITDASIYIGKMVDADPAYVPAFRTAEKLYAQVSGNVQVVGGPVTVRLMSSFIVGFRQFFKDAKAAHAAFASMVETEPTCAVAHLKMGVLDVLNGKDQEAIGHLKRAEELAPNDSELYFAVGSAYYNLGERDARGEASPQWKRALEYYRKATIAAPSYADAYWGAGSSLYKMGKHLEAIEPLEVCLKINPFFAEGYNTLAAVFTRLGELETTDAAKRATWRERAVQAYQQSLRANPGAEAVHYNLGVVYHQQDKWKEAREEYEAAVRLNPKFCVAWYRIARMYIDRRGWFDKGRAEEAFRKVMECEPGNCDYGADYGAFYFNTRQYEKAKAQWRGVLAKCPDHKASLDGIEKLIERGY